MRTVNNADMLSMSVTELISMLSSKKLCSAEITKAYIDSIDRHDSEINAYITILREAAVKQAEETDKARARGECLSRLAGIPVAIKDNICTKGVKTTCGSKTLSDFVPPYNATVIEKLAQNGAVILGKTNMDEFGMGSTCQNSYFGQTRNPVDTSKVAGGSSGGSAAAVSSHLAPFALGTDTGGSVRLPASNCGIVGIKPTYGSVSRYGLIAFASSLDQIGVMGNNITDACVLLDAIRGFDRKDSTSVNRIYTNLTESLFYKPCRRLRVGVTEDCFSDCIDDDIRICFSNAIKTFERTGAEIIKLSFTPYKQALACYYIISSAEASSNLSRYDGVRYGFRTENAKNAKELYMKSRSEGFGGEVKRRILLGTFVLSSGYYDNYYQRAIATKQMIASDYESAFQNVDVIITPTTPHIVPPLEHKLCCTDIYKSDMFTIYPSLAGLPALSVPCGTDRYGMPIGLQIVANHFCEETMLRAGLVIEENINE